MKQNWSELELNYLKENYPSCSNALIATSLNRSEESVKLKAQRIGVSKSHEYLTSLRASKWLNYSLNMARRKTEIAEQQVSNHHVFDSVDNESSAYWLGFLAADAAVQPKNNTVCLNLGAKDIEHLKLFSSFVGCSNVPKLRGRGTYALSFASRRIHQALTSFGIISNRATTFNVPEVPPHVFHHFVRGFIDGDGWVSAGSNPEVGLIASHVFCTQIEKTVNDMIALPGRVRSTKSNLYKYNIYGKNRVKKFKMFLMNEATIFLERKWS
jgi:hypothetical protein